MGAAARAAYEERYAPKGSHASSATAEDAAVVETIRAGGARLMLVGIRCPREK